MSRQTRFGWLSNQASLPRQSAARQRVACPTQRPLRFESLECRLALATLTVTSLADGPVDLADSVVTLRDAIHAANENLQVAPGGATGSGADEIRFQVGLAGVITLNQGLLAIRSDLSITGPGANVLTISGNNAFRVFDLNEGVDAALKVVSLSGMTIANGSYPSYHGGGITNRENLTITGCTIRDNFAGVSGGGIFNFASGTLTVQNSTLSGNAALGDGGGITSHGALTVQNSTISGNVANFSGGAIASFGNVVTVQNSTLTQNRAEFNVDAQGEGGGIWFVDTTVRLHNSIVSGNYKFTTNTTPSDIVAYNGGVHGLSSNNLIGTGGAGGIVNGVNGNQVGVANPGLGPLANNGGTTLTHALLSWNSPAFNAGNNAQAPGATDQRGGAFTRIVNGTVDIGAFEFQPVSLVVGADVDEDDANYASGDLSLREAINLANAFDGADMITFSSFFSTPRTISLTQGQLGLRSDLTITGPGAALLTITANNASRVLDVADLSPVVRTVAISGMTITGGSSPTYSGGGIINRENLTIAGCIIRDNSSGISSGGIANFETLTLRDSVISGNTASAGGGMVNQGVATIQNCTVSGNNASRGGGILNEVGAVLTVQNSTISGHSAIDGAGIFSRGNLTVENTTISGNTVSNQGGGIHSFSGILLVRNCTITANHAAITKVVTPNELTYGGGIAISYNSAVTLHNSIVSGNVEGGAMGFPRLASDLVVDGFPNSPPKDVAGTNNLIGGAIRVAGITNGDNGNQIGVFNPQLGPLADNGGPTLTHALLAGSPAVDAGNPAFTSPPNFDQRGSPFARVSNGRIDIGAYEVQVGAPPSADFDGDDDVDGHDFLAWQRGLGTPAPGALKSHGDADNDYDVDGADLAVWKSQFGNLPPAEPALAASALPSFSETRSPVAEIPDNSAADAVFAAGDFTRLFANSADDADHVRSYRPRRRW